MTNPKDSIVVLDIAGKHARISCGDPSKEVVLSNSGFSKDGGLLVRPIQDDDDRKQLVQLLVGLGCLFSEGKDWSPAELVAYYKEQGLALGDYRVIAWRAPDDFFVTVRS